MEYVTTTCGTQLEYLPDIIGEGAMKIVYMSPNKKYVVCKYKEEAKVTIQDRERVKKIVTTYRQTIFQNTGGTYFQDKMCWPTHMFDNPKDGFGVICPVYSTNFFFNIGRNEFVNSPKAGKEKNGRWFLSLFQRNCLHQSELGEFTSYLRMALLLAQSVRRLHSAGIIHSDLSNNNVLLDPIGRTICIIDMDTLVVKDMFPPAIQGTPGYIAPEVMDTLYLPINDSRKKLVTQKTELHSLAVMIYELLMYRHPLRGPKIHDPTDPKKDEDLMMGKRAVFIEHPTDLSNRPNSKWVQEYYGKKKLRNNTKIVYLPWGLPDKTPYTILGPYLSPLIEKAFVKGLHDPSNRPQARDWEKALVRTVDNILPCSNKNCTQKFFIYNEQIRPTCPYCGTQYGHQLPMLELYYTQKDNQYTSENHRVVLFHGSALFTWHINRFVVPNEKLQPEQREAVARIIYRDGKWLFVNKSLKNLLVIDSIEKESKPIFAQFELKQGMKLILDSDRGGRLAVVRFAHQSGTSIK